ncbi:SDR family oxidoreductase [Bradyrhizobium sp. LA7.1]|uniref:SDR family oxidoreductase n=1 Tax=Bradyrhizobium sp. LA7.1 TaxID=3156324 RepID=UPI003392F92D
MDLGLACKRALVCASSKGLGFACATSLAREGCEVTVNGRNGERLRLAAKSIETIAGRPVTFVQADIAEEAGRRKLIEACPEPDILINNNHGPAPGNFLEFGRTEWLEAIEQNMLAPLHFVKTFLPGMRDRKFGRIINITSAMVKAPHPQMELSSGARAGLTAACKSLARQYAAYNVTINNLLPERIDTDRQRFMAERMMSDLGISLEEARKRIADSLPAKRFGKPEEFGDACAFLCSAQAGFITGQNLQLDGGSYPGLI